MENLTEIIWNGFRGCGLCHFEENNIKHEKYFKTTAKLSESEEETVIDYKKLLLYFETECKDKICQFKRPETIYIGLVMLKTAACIVFERK